MSIQSEISFLDRLHLRGGEHLCVEEVLTAPGCYFAICTAGKKLVGHFPVLLSPSLQQHSSSIAAMSSETAQR